jgi:hypothetical protein
VAELNPYAAEPELSRWSEGFVKALGADVKLNGAT